MRQNISLVTGAGGFVGGHMVRALVERGDKVRGMVRNPAQSEEVKALGADVVVADLRKEDTLREAVKGVRYVYHIASLFRQAGLPESVFYDINAEGTRRIFEASIAAGVERLVHCSTVGVLGHVEHPPADEHAPFAPGDMYQRTKLEGEKIAMEYYRSGKMSGVVIRPAMIYGPGDTRNFKMWKMVARRCWFYLGDGTTRVHFIDARDLAQAFILAMEKKDLQAEVYIIPGEKSVSQKYMADLIAKELGVARPWIHLPIKPMQWLGSLCEAVCTPLRIQPPIYRRRVDFFTKHREFNGAKAGRDLGFKPARTFEEEIADITRWYRAEGWV